FHRINPLSFIFLEQKTADGSIRRWAVEGPSGFQTVLRKTFSSELKPGGPFDSPATYRSVRGLLSTEDEAVRIDSVELDDRPLHADSLRGVVICERMVSPQRSGRNERRKNCEACHVSSHVRASRYPSSISRPCYRLVTAAAT